VRLAQQRKPAQELAEPDTDGEADRAREHDERRGLGCELPPEAPERRSDGHADAELAAPARRPRQNEETDIGSGNEGKQHARGEQHEQLTLRLAQRAQVGHEAVGGIRLPARKNSEIAGEIRISRPHLGDHSVCRDALGASGECFEAQARDMFGKPVGRSNVVFYNGPLERQPDCGVLLEAGNFRW
jgi:hypothetical protein